MSIPADWNLTQTWAWIRWRDPAKTAAFAAETHLGIAEAIMFPDGTAIAEEDHRGSLLAALLQGRLTAHGRPAAADATAMAVAVPAADWAGLVPVAPSEARLAAGRRVAWRTLAFPAADVQKLWPGPGAPPPRERISLSV